MRCRVIPILPSQRHGLVGLLAIAVGSMLGSAPNVQGAEVPIRNVPPSPAPPLDGGVGWLNTAQPLSLPQLRGKIVVLDFWTYCCINCLQILPDLRRLEQAYPNEVVVIGVHAPKFFGERDTDNIREAIMRHGIIHPVVNDANAIIARRYKIGGWPALRFIDPSGVLIAAHNGEATFEALNDFMKRTVAKYRRLGEIDEAPLRFELEHYEAPSTPLRFPGKLLADATSGRLFIADSGHHRIVIASLDGQLIDTVGSGAMGHADGGFDQAQFSSPQGLALVGDRLYVADTENHMLRQIDLQNKTVTTLAGTGEQADQMLARSSRQPARTRLASPWALLPHDDELYIAMAGTHQIWRYSLSRRSLHPFAGNGVEDIVDGAALARTATQPDAASFAQPSSLASDGQRLYVADSEGSSIRAIDLQRNARVTTVLGTAAQPQAMRLFTYGDRDGPVSQALLQHPLGVAIRDSQLYVADTYNNKIKVIDLTRQTIHTLAGDGRSGESDVPPRFNEPAGLSVTDTQLFVADTNNHLIRVIELAEPYPVSTLDFEGLAPPEQLEMPAPPLPQGLTVEVKPTQVATSGDALPVTVRLFLPRGATIKPDVPMSYVVTIADGDEILDPKAVGKRTSVPDPASEFEISLPLARRSGSATLEISLAYFYCEEQSKDLCRIGNVSWTAPVELNRDARADRVLLEYAVR